MKYNALNYIKSKLNLIEKINSYKNSNLLMKIYSNPDAWKLLYEKLENEYKNFSKGYQYLLG